MGSPAHRMSTQLDVARIPRQIWGNASIPRPSPHPSPGTNQISDSIPEKAGKDGCYASPL